MKTLSRTTLLSAIIGTIIYMLLFLFVDKSVDLWVHAHWANTWVNDLGNAISTLAKGSYVRLGLALCFILIIIIDPKLTHPWSRPLLYICLSCAIALVIGEGLKYLLGRYRPSALFKHDLYGFHFFAETSSMHSSPSGHTLRAFSVLTALSLLYRRLVIPCIGLAILIGTSRIVVTAHYPSDVLLGAFIGIFSALWTYHYLIKATPIPNEP